MFPRSFYRLCAHNGNEIFLTEWARRGPQTIWRYNSRTVIAAGSGQEMRICRIRITAGTQPRI
jgi:hypothetical protein